MVWLNTCLISRRILQKSPVLEVLTNNIAIFNDAKFEEIVLEELRRYFETSH